MNLRTNRPATLAAAAVLIVAGLAACGSTTPAKTSKPSPSYAADSVTARCHAQHWPQSMPDVTGKRFDPLGKDLQCFDNITALAPDGHDVMNDPANETAVWIVTSSRPGRGAQVSLSTRITLELRAEAKG
ncbi:hypothetical protein ABZU94_10475 [Streptomyces mirabilis]|uniref:hypothetical protein n=1 Tax=Streptomyces sp. NPDC005388 TaxID=3156717 RepID=UPI0033BE8022